MPPGYAVPGYGGRPMQPPPPPPGRGVPGNPWMPPPPGAPPQP
jgi:hypothetical protein